MSDTFKPRQTAVRRPLRRESALKRRARVALVALAAGALTLSSVAESYAQRGFGRGFNGAGVRGPGTVGRFTGDRTRFPGGRGPRFPGGIGILTIPGGFGPSGRPVVIYDDGDDFGPQRRRTRRAEKKAKQSQRQIANRGGFNAPPPGEQRYVPNEVLLNIGADLSTPQLDAIARKHRLTRLDLRDYTITQRRIARVRINDGRPVATVIRSLQAEARVLGAQPNYLYALQGADGSPAPQYSLAKMHLPEAHAITTGGGVLVAVIDSMIDANHPDLQGVIAASFDAVAADKPDAHGTGMAGVIAAHGKLTGTAPAVKILAAHSFTPGQWGGRTTTVLDGLEWAGKQNANIINMSFAGASDEEIHLMLQRLRARGAVLVAAAGNAGPQAKPQYPGAYPEVIAVTATDSDDKVFKHANRGTHIAVAAPGVDILAAAPGGSYQVTSGTSAAAAEVSGVAALILDRNRRLDAAAIRHILMSTARDLGAPGHDDQFGSGLVDALGAVMQATPQSSDVSGSAPAGAN